LVVTNWSRVVVPPFIDVVVKSTLYPLVPVGKVPVNAASPLLVILFRTALNLGVGEPSAMESRVRVPLSVSASVREV
jgi:hypothetical protein